LKATIIKEFPFLEDEVSMNVNFSESISRPFLFFNESKKNSMNITLAHIWIESQINPKGYWISEKFDGIRAIWKENSLFSRFGNKFDFPDWRKIKSEKGLVLDGELFIGYN